MPLYRKNKQIIPYSAHYDGTRVELRIQRSKTLGWYHNDVKICRSNVLPSRTFFQTILTIFANQRIIFESHHFKNITKLQMLFNLWRRGVKSDAKSLFIVYTTRGCWPEVVGLFRPTINNCMLITDFFSVLINKREQVKSRVTL